MDNTDKQKSFLDKLLSKKRGFTRNVAEYVRSGTLKQNKLQRNSVMQKLKDNIEKFGDKEEDAKKAKTARKLLAIVEKEVEETNADEEENNTTPVLPEAPILKDGSCDKIYDPCTREPLQTIEDLEKRVKEIKNNKTSNIESIKQFSADINNRLKLLLYILNNKEKPNISLLEYNISGQLYEAYWDIVFSLGLINEFPITKDFYMFNGKIEELTNINDKNFINNPLDYLSLRKINAGNKTGASDITFIYKKQKININDDACSVDPTIKVSQSCKTKSKREANSNIETPLFYFCSSKYYTNDAKKGVDKFDIQNIYTAAKKLNELYEKKIILLVKDKTAVEEKIRKAMRKYISDEASYVFGISDLFAYLTKFYDFIHSKNDSDIITEEILAEILDYKQMPKPILNLRLHQYIASYKITESINSFKKTKNNNKFLVGIVPRGGKTYIAGGIIDILKPKRVVVLLGAKSETLTQFKDDLFEFFQNFNEYTCIDVVNDDINYKIEDNKKYIFIMSVELYKNADSTRLLLQELKSGVHRADLFICDEAHLKQTTSKAVREMEKGTQLIDETDEISDEEEKNQLKDIDKVISSDIPVVYMTGTYIKPLSAFRIPDENVIIWDYQDIQQAKELILNENYFIENFGELYKKALNTCISYGETYETIQNMYRKFPELYLLTTQFTPDAKNAFLQQEKAGFPTITHLFEVKKDFNPETTPPELWYTGFKNPKSILRLLKYLSPINAKVDDIEIEKISSVLTSIDHIAQRIGDRLGFFTSEFIAHSQLWFLPHMQGNPLYKRMCALAGAIFQMPWFRKYFHVLGVSSSIKWNIPKSESKRIKIQPKSDIDSCGTFSWICPSSKSLKECLIDEEAYARSKGKGLIILAQNMLHLGISLPCVDIVVLLDSGDKIDERIQKMYRALTESTNKKGGYIIDMNYFRTVNAIMNYQIITEKTRRGKKQVYSNDIKDIFNKVLDIYSIDDDKPLLRTDIEKETLPELQKLLESKKTSDSIVLEDAGKSVNSNIKDVLLNDYRDDYKLFLGMLKENEEKIRKIREDSSNVKKAEYNDNNNSKLNSENIENYEPKIFKETDTRQQKIEAYLDIFKTTLKLGAFGTDSIDIKKLNEQLLNDEDLRDTLYDTLIKRGAIIEDKEHSELQKNFIIDGLIIPSLIKMVNENKNSSYSKMKETIEDDEKYPLEVEKVLSYIKDNLTPKDAERHKHGEVFTPMSLVNEMLDTLPNNVWNDKSLKWLDPANGMGNYPIAVFLRLFYGFRTKDDKYIGITSEGEGKFNPGLTEVIKNDDTRRNHIVKNMLYMVELNSKNNAIAKNLFKKLAPGVEPNIIQMHRKDGFLADIEMKFPNGTVNEFDIIMGNPPFQGGAVKSVTTNATKKMRKEMDVAQDKHKNLWIPFVKKSIDILTKSGYLLFIHPIGWFKPDEKTKTHDLLLSQQIILLRIYFKSQAKKLFGGRGEISVGYYLLKKEEPTKKTQIINIDNKKEEVLLNTKSLLCLKNNSIVAKIQSSNIVLFGTSDDYQTTSINQKGCQNGKNKQIHRITDEGNITFVETGNLHKYQSIPKIILNGSKYPRYFYDKKGEYGLIGSHQQYFIGNDLDTLEDYFKTKLSAVLLSSLKYDMDYIEPRYYPDVRTLPLEKITDETLADYFGFTKEEREAINATEYPKREYIFKEITCAELKKEKGAETGGAKPHNTTRKLKKSF